MKLNIHIGLFVTILLAVLAAGYTLSWLQGRMEAKKNGASTATEGGAEAAAPAVAAA